MIIDCLRITEQQTAFYADGLYKGIVWLKGGNEKLLYVGALWLVTSVQTTDTQAVWVVQYITGRSPIGLEGTSMLQLFAFVHIIQVCMITLECLKYMFRLERFYNYSVRV